jgi:uncharacterized protein (TIGR03435 family)
MLDRIYSFWIMFRFIFAVPFAYCVLSAQAIDNPSFEVASIKPSNPTKGIVGAYTYPGGRIFLGHATLERLISYAFDIQSFQIRGGSSWIRTEKYDINAKPPRSSESAKAQPATNRTPLNSEQREMLLSLLADRFRLRFHREETEASVMFLTKGKNLKFENPANVNAFPWVGSATEEGAIAGTGIRGINASMSLLAERLTWYFERPVIDRTGIQGSFDFKSQMSWDGPPITNSSSLRSTEVLSSIITSLQRIGLKLETGRGRVETIVVDAAEKPSPN